MDKGSGSGSGIFPDPDQDPGDPKKTGSGSATLVTTLSNFHRGVVLLFYTVSKIESVMCVMKTRKKESNY